MSSQPRLQLCVLFPPYKEAPACCSSLAPLLALVVQPRPKRSTSIRSLSKLSLKTPDTGPFSAYTAKMKATLLLAAALAAPALAAPVPEGGKVAARQYATYGDYAGATYSTYGDYAGAGTDSAPAASAYSSYGTYPPPAGGYSSYGTYKRAVEWVKSLFA